MYSINKVDNSILLPIAIDNLCLIKPFKKEHKLKLPLEIYLNDENLLEMGNQISTFLLLQYLSHSCIKDKKILIYECQSGLLAILASILESKEIKLVTSNYDSLLKIKKNIILNKANKIQLSNISIREFSETEYYDIIIDNSTTQNFLEKISIFKKMLTPQTGELIIGEISKTRNFDTVKHIARACNLLYISHYEQNGFIVAKFMI